MKAIETKEKPIETDKVKIRPISGQFNPQKVKIEFRNRESNAYADKQLAATQSTGAFLHG